MKSKTSEVTPLEGMAYFFPADDAVLTAREGRVSILYDGLPIPLLMDDFTALENSAAPSYDAVGRGLYQALRLDPECQHSERYALIIRDAYPHLLAELITHLLMLDKKDVDIAYIDRKIASLKILSLLQPDDYRIPFEIGRSYLEKGTTLSAVHMAAMSLYKALDYLERANHMDAGDPLLAATLGEVAYLLGKYEKAEKFWRDILQSVEGGQKERLEKCLAAIAGGNLPRVAPVDYLEAAGAAFELHEQGEYEEAGAILSDILDDAVFVEHFPLPQLNHILGLCCERMALPRYAEEYYRQALAIDPDFVEASRALDALKI